MAFQRARACLKIKSMSRQLIISKVKSKVNLVRFIKSCSFLNFHYTRKFEMIFKKLKVAPECLEVWQNLKEKKMKGVIFTFSQNMVSVL